MLTWGPDYYYQKQFFSGHDDPLSQSKFRMHYDLEVSGFPSSHAGHLVLLGLKDQDYPEYQEDRGLADVGYADSQWAKSQDAVVGLRIRDGGWRLPMTRYPAFRCRLSTVSGRTNTLST